MPYSGYHKYVPIGKTLRQYKIPPAPLFEKGGRLTLPSLLFEAIGVLIRIQAFISSPFEKGDRGI